MTRNLLVVLCLIIAAPCSAVTSRIVHHKTASDLSDSETENVVISSRGTIQLSSDTELLTEDFGTAWLINTIVRSDDGSIYVGTSPNGEIFKYTKSETKKIYPAGTEKVEDFVTEPNDPNDPNAQQGTYTTNTHIFKMTTDSKGKLLAAVSGDTSALIKYNGKDFETIFEPNDASYIFDIVLDKKGNIFLGTGPNGKLYKLNPAGEKPELIYTCKDKNILALAAGDEGIIYAGTDTRGLVYKIDTAKKTASILYDSDQDEISDLILDDDGYLYAAATSYKSIKAQLNDAGGAKSSMPGRPETSPTLTSDGKSLTLKIPNSKEENAESQATPPPTSMQRSTAPGAASCVYKIDQRGFVEKVFTEVAVFFCLDKKDNTLILGTGNKAQLYIVDIETETETLSYEDQTASQITDIVTSGNTSYIATANPPKLIKLSPGFAATGNLASPLIDAGQPASWGKLQIDADIPTGAQILLSARSGNVNEANDPTFSQWTTPEKITAPTELNIPLGRFCQYKLILKGSKKTSPQVRQIATAYLIPNLPPKVKTIEVSAADKKEKKGFMKIAFAAADENADTLQYKIDFRRADRLGWIELKDELTETNFDWNSKTVEDGIYEVKVTASDIKSNTVSTKLTGSRISDPVTIDNTAPTIAKEKVKTSKDTATVELQIRDTLSVIGSLSYTIDSNEDFNPALPNDSIYDTLEENFTITLKDLSKGQHVLAVKVSDVEENIAYKTFDIEIK